MSSAVYYPDANVAIDWLCRAFGFEVILKVVGDDGRVEHSEVGFGGGIVMVADGGPHARRPYFKSPTEVGGGNTQSIMVYVDDVEAHCKRAREAGATITMEPKTSDYGDEYWTDRSYECVDVGGHRWWFAERLRSAKPEA
jgi:uncharacterized glyoxalase superfamily protein PhnB